LDAYVFDAYAWLAHLCNEAGAQVVEGLLFRARDGEVGLATSAINVGEVYYRLARISSAARAAQAVAEITASPAVLVLPTMAHVLQAAQMKSVHRVSYADCFCAALAMDLGATIVTGDSEFKVFEADVPILWLP